MRLLFSGGGHGSLPLGDPRPSALGALLLVAAAGSVIVSVRSVVVCVLVQPRRWAVSMRPSDVRTTRC
jgi:hypothetical protein